MQGPLPHIPLLPTGGVDLGNVDDFMKAGAVGVGLGSALVNTKIATNEQYYQDLEQTAKQFHDIVHLKKGRA
ncbi:4-hydroxy-2-ketovalerate aldolase [Staphylococcus aureus]|nr:4-hydroxy-2-ketovalerate aldolase [Staphylococcus aureus]